MDVLLLNEVSDGLWRQFAEGRRTAIASQPVVERWSRVADLGLPAEGPSTEAVVDAAALRERLDENVDLMRAARPVFGRSARLFAEHDFVLLLTDARGIVLLRTAGGEFDEEATRARLIAGAEWSEPVRGTNAIGTALFEQRPVGVVGSAHYARPHHGLACYASPIWGPDGQLRGLVDATSRHRAASRLVQLAVCGVARSIEASLGAQARSAELRAFRPLLDRMAEPAMVLSSDGRVAYENVVARNWKGRAEIVDELAGCDLASAARKLHSSEEAVFQVEQLSPSLWLVTPRAAAGRPSPPPPSRSRESAFRQVLGSDPALASAKTKAERFAETPIPVLLAAETGTGKELFARAIHAASPRSERPFVALNCGAISAQLLESELFGYGDGAFTGAKAGGQPGKLEAADGGTLFLDEIAEMPPSVQAALLRVLENGTFFRVGEVVSRTVDLRLVCATCRDLSAMVADGDFRSDLYYRIRGASITLPPLRARTDLAELMDQLLADLAGALGRPAPSLSPEARAELLGHDWPGNIRELKSALSHALVLAEHEVRPEHLPLTPAPSARKARVTSRASAERGALQAALTASRGNLSDAARRLKVARSTLYRMMVRHGLQRADD